MASDPVKRRQAEQLRQLREGRPEEALYDEWFYKLPKWKQDEYRNQDPPILPYAELPLPRNIFPIYDTDIKYASADPRKDDDTQSINEGWVTIERVKEIIGDVLAMLGASPNKDVRGHFLLCKIILGCADAPTQVELAKKLGLTKQAISVRAKNLVRHADSIAPGFMDRIKFEYLTDKSEPGAPDQQNQAKEPGKGALRNLFASSHKVRGASTTGKNPVFPSGESRETARGQKRRASK